MKLEAPIMKAGSSEHLSSGKRRLRRGILLAGSALMMLGASNALALSIAGITATVGVSPSIVGIPLVGVTGNLAVDVSILGSALSSTGGLPAGVPDVGSALGSASGLSALSALPVGAATEILPQLPVL